MLLLARKLSQCKIWTASMICVLPRDRMLFTHKKNHNLLLPLVLTLEQAILLEYKFPQDIRIGISIRVMIIESI